MNLNIKEIYDAYQRADDGRNRSTFLGYIACALYDCSLYDSEEALLAIAALQVAASSLEVSRLEAQRCRLRREALETSRRCPWVRIRDCRFPNEKP
jgi:hypothetical protein